MAGLTGMPWMAELTEVPVITENDQKKVGRSVPILQAALLNRRARHPDQPGQSESCVGAEGHDWHQSVCTGVARFTSGVIHKAGQDDVRHEDTHLGIDEQKTKKYGSGILCDLGRNGK